jgi:hypothetical protein
MSALTNVPVVTLGIARGTPIAVLTELSKTVVTTMTVNKGTFSAPSPALALVSAAIATLESTQTAYKAHLGTREARDEARTALLQLLRQLRVYVQSLVSATPAQAETIAKDAAMGLRRSTHPHKSDLAVKQVATGSVKVVAKALKGARAHDFQYSTDGGKTWIGAPVSTQAHATITGLVPGTTVLCRHRPITKVGPGDWSQTVTAVVT